MALANLIGNYTADQNAVASDILTDLQSLLARVNTVTNEQLEDGSVTQGKMASLSVGLAQLIDGTLSADVSGRAKMADEFVTLAKIAASARISYIRVQENQTSGTNGGTSATGIWNTRKLNSIEDNSASVSASLALDEITLPAATYWCRITSPASQANGHRIRLRNVTDGANVLVGSNETTQVGTVDTRATCVGLFTIAAAKGLQVQHWTNVGTATVGLGHAVSSGDSEVYTVAEFWKLPE